MNEALSAGRELWVSSPAVTLAEDSAGPASSRDERLVLVVEDDANASLLCRLLLERAGFTVICASDGETGIALAQEHAPAAIVLDLMLPDMDGITVLEALSAAPGVDAIPVVMLTARTDPRDQQGAWEAGVSEYLTKPYDADRLLAAVHAVIAEGIVGRTRRREEALERFRERNVRALEVTVSIVEHSEDAIIGMTLDGVITSWNQAAADLYGYASEETIGHPSSMLVPSASIDETPELLERVGRGGHVSHYETVRQRKGGELVEVSLSLSPMKSAAGVVIGASAIARDDTERRRSEARFRSLVETAPDAMVIVDERGIIELVNAQTERLFGYPRTEMVGQPVEMLVPLDQRGVHPQHRADYIAAAKPRWMGAGLDLHGLRKDGTKFPVEISLSPLESGGGMTVSAAIRDVTERKQAEARYRSMLEAAPDAIVAIDTVGRIQFVNAQTETLFGYPRAEMLGQLVEILIPDQHRRAHPGHRENYFAEPRTRPMGAGLDLVARRRDGSEFPVEISLSSIQIEEDVLVSAAIRDVTERKQAEARFRGLVEAAPDAMVIVDAKGRIELVNAQTERLFRYSRDELLGCAVEVLVPERFRARHPQHRLGYLAAAKVRRMGDGIDLFGLRKDGTEFPVEISLSHMVTEHGMTVSASIRDVTDRRKAEDARAQAFDQERQAVERLLQVDRLRIDFLSTVSHELRTPLTTINGFAAILSESWGDYEEGQKRDFVGNIAGAGARLAELIDDLLDFSRIERGQLVFVAEHLGLSDLVADALRRTRLALENHTIELLLTADLVVLADASAAARVIDNLLDNAAKFSPRGSAISISTQRSDGHIALTVTDEGVGIPPEELDRIFDRFYRVGGQHNRRPGTGVGLAIVKEFTEAQHGRVEVISTVGEGSRFTILLPVG